MTYKEILKTLLNQHYLVSDNYKAKVLLISLWLEDINWHTDNALFIELATKEWLLTEEELEATYNLDISALASTFGAITSWGFDSKSGFNHTHGVELAHELIDLIKEVEEGRWK